MTEIEKLHVLLIYLKIPCSKVSPNNRLRVYASESTSYFNITIEFANPSTFAWCATSSEGVTFGMCHSFADVAIKVAEFYMEDLCGRNNNS